MMLDHAGVVALLQRLADAWAAPDATAAAACFTEDALYIEPPDVQLFHGREQLAAYFSPLQPGTYLRLNGVWWDEDRQTGAVEFSFGTVDNPVADHGVAVVAARDGLLSSWREYHRKGPADFAEFLAVGGKQWRWHIGNYP